MKKNTQNSSKKWMCNTLKKQMDVQHILRLPNSNHFTNWQYSNDNDNDDNNSNYAKCKH